MMISEPSSSLILNAPNEGLFLDAGCGECYYTNILMSKSRRIISLDIQNPHNLQSNVNYSFILSSVEYIPFKENSFDFICCLSTIQLIKDDKTVIKEISRILKPGGTFYFTVPTRRSPFRIIRDLEIRFGTYKYSQFNFTHYHYYSKKDIENLIQDFFYIESISGYKFNFTRRLLNFILDLLKIRKNIETLYHSMFAIKKSDHSPHIWNNYIKGYSEHKYQEKKKNIKRMNSPYRPIYGLAYHYIITAIKK
ncbi:class I SAM-dependent methyltransferase [Methanofollis aquaemaris]|uniref:Class I SAM-dependent methyltransferase n=1 Tax=Methanofollis aquaemaris TaxID=126734 RepID=A0A8A3S892_9EURY|nr:class I SAM-dependent methyltransferase [Methanofollis aquaemaris]QSZ67931.1 class I SAM-dependent methyltransferase [Methanofollis aquaemaris]